MDKKQIKIWAMPFVSIGILCIIVCGLALLIFLLVYPFNEPLTGIYLGITIFCLVVLPIVCIILAIYFGYFSIITINENGIKRAFLGVFNKIELTWEEVYTIKYFNRIVGNIFISQYEDLATMTLEDAANKHKLIRMQISKKVLKAIRKYTDKEIIGLSKEQEQKILANTNTK